MKKSNKILIGFAASLLLIPLIGMAIVSATMYKKGKYSDLVDVVDNSYKDFKSKSPAMHSIAITQNFNGVEITDGKRKGYIIRLIKDEDFGVKIDDKNKEIIEAKVDAQGKLQITIKENEIDEEDRREYVNLIVYSPNITNVVIDNADMLELLPMDGTLNLSLNRIGSFYFGNETKFDQLNLKANKVKDLMLRRDQINKIDVMLTDSKFGVESMSIANAKIITNGDCKIDIYSQEDAKKHTIGELYLQTNGIAAVEIDKMIINNCTGSFSNQTTVKMPAAYINQMYNLK